MRLDGRRDHVVVLTDRGRNLLEANRRDCHPDHRQEFHARLVKPREVEHDAQIFRAYLREAKRLENRGARIDRVILDYELKREYQTWLNERDRDRDARADREPWEIERWAQEHDLPYIDDQVHFPDLRIEDEDVDGRSDHVDVEVLTVHYRGAHGAAAAKSGFSCYRGSSARIEGCGSSRTGGGYVPELAGELFD